MAREKAFLCIFVLFSFTQISVSDYVAAVVEFQPTTPLNGASQTMEFNLQSYVTNIAQAKKEGVQIIVFPEYGITGYTNNITHYAIEVPDVNSGPKFNDSFILEKLSDAAKSYQIYVVVNLLEKKANGTDKTKYYNTNLVFDKNGKIIAKYRKLNLFDEPEVSPGIPSENTNVFTTDFGVTFGVFTCYDLVWNNPSRTILQNSNVTDIVYPTAWSSFLPFYHSLSVQHGYAMANKVNLLAANLNGPEVGVGGSGIFGADGTVYRYYISGIPGTKLLTTTIVNTPKTTRLLGGSLGSFNFDTDSDSDLVKFNSSRFFESEKYTYKNLNLSQQFLTEQICHKSFCCQFKLNVSSTSNSSLDVYKLVAYSGVVNIFGGKQQIQKICSIVACETTDVKTCGKQTAKISSKFDSILVESTTSGVSDFIPLSLTTDLVPVFNVTFNSTIVSNSKKLTFGSQVQQSNVLAFGIIGTVPSSATTSVFSCALVAVIFLRYLLF